MHFVAMPHIAYIEIISIAITEITVSVVQHYQHNLSELRLLVSG